MANEYRNHVEFTTIASGGTLSGPINIQGFKDIAVWVPTVDNTQVAFKASYDANSANFVDVIDSVAQTGNLSWNAGTGRDAMVVVDHLSAFPFIKVSLSAAQSDTRTLAVIGKRFLE